MNFKILFAVTLFIILVCFGGVACAEPELTVVSINFEKDIIRQGESTKVNVSVKNTGDSPAYDISFVIGLNRLDLDNIKIDGHIRKKDVGKFREYFIDTKKTSINPGEIKTAVYVVTATAPEKEEYELKFVTGGRSVKDPRLSIKYNWWPTHMDRGKGAYLKIELPPDYYFKKAEEYFKSGSYENAKEYANKAKEIYINSGNNEKASDCDKMILQSEKIIEAYIVYKRARKRMDVGDFGGATSNAELAIKLYNEIASIDSDLVLNEVSELKLMIEEVNKTVAAWEYLDNATKYFDKGKEEFLDFSNYEKATEYAEKAKEIYLGVGDFDSVLRCNSLINKIELYVDRNLMILNVGYAGVAIILILILLLLYKKYRDRRYMKRRF